MEAQTASTVPAAKVVPPTSPAQLTTAPARPVQTPPTTHPTQAAPATKTSGPAAPAHVAQAVPTVNAPTPAPGVTSPKTAPPAAPATTPTVTDPARGIADITMGDDNAPTTASIDTEAEAKLTTEIVRLWGDHRDGKIAVRRTRAEMKTLRLELGSKLHAMKAILVGTGREGGWAPYLREQKLPVATADRLVGEHQATLAAPKDKFLSEELPEVTVDEVRKLTKKMLSKLQHLLTSAELAFAFIDELFWNLEAAEGRETDDGVEVFRKSHEDATAVEAEVAELAISAPAAA